MSTSGWVRRRHYVAMQRLGIKAPYSKTFKAAFEIMQREEVDLAIAKLLSHSAAATTLQVLAAITILNRSCGCHLVWPETQYVVLIDSIVWFWQVAAINPTCAQLWAKNPTVVPVCLTDVAGAMFCCGICHQQYQDRTPITALWCGHTFHQEEKSCSRQTHIDAWLKQHHACPVCQQNKPPPCGVLADFAPPLRSR